MSQHPDDVIMFIRQGANYDGGFMLSSEGSPLPEGDWAGKLSIYRNIGAPDVLASFATTGGDGTLEIDETGAVLLHMDAAATALIPTTTDSRGQQSQYWVADLIVWPTATPAEVESPDNLFCVYVRPEVTAP